ncbi:MAG TPA: lipopolysaccharide kinase InaA family protein [Planctomycetota bacterium]|nr:lipopolysaccharide kinase InaA family protein [Planctomycetota bacterium]
MKVLVACAECEADVRAWLQSPGQGKVLKENRLRSVHLWKGLCVKRFKNPGLGRAVRGRLLDPARAEYRLLLELRSRGLDVPEPVAWARLGRETVVFTREIADAVPLRVLPMNRDRLRALARLVRRAYDVGLRHDDLHVGNVLEGAGRLWLVDLQEARLKRALSEEERAASAAFLTMSFYESVSRTETLRFWRAVGVDPARVWPAFRALRHRYWAGRRARVRRSGSDFEVVDGLVLRRPFTAEEARRVFTAPPFKRVKELPNRRLWLADAGTFVKEGAGEAWSNAYGLEIRSIPTPRMKAKADGRIAGEWLEGALPLWDHLKAHGVSRPLLERLARIVRRMHQRGVYHRDLKANNVLVRGQDAWIIDLDRVDFRLELTREQRVFNLAQLNAAVGPPATRSDRLRFFFVYAALEPSILRDWKSWVREIMDRTRARKHHWPEREGR